MLIQVAFYVFDTSSLYTMNAVKWYCLSGFTFMFLVSSPLFNNSYNKIRLFFTTNFVEIERDSMYIVTSGSRQVVMPCMT